MRYGTCGDQDYPSSTTGHPSRQRPVLQLYDAPGAGRVISSARLRLREVTGEDAPFVLALYTDPEFLANIGDRGVRTLESARRYIAEGPVRSYHEQGFGLYLMATKDSGNALGMCGLLRRDWHPYVEIGFALLPAARGHGYAYEAATAVVEFARASLRLERLTALTAPDNQRSIRILERLGMRFERMVRAPDAPGDSRLFGLQFQPAGEESATPFP